MSNVQAERLRFLQGYYNQSIPTGDDGGDTESFAPGMTESFAMGAPMSESELPDGVPDDAPSESDDDERVEDEDAPIESDDETVA